MATIKGNPAFDNNSSEASAKELFEAMDGCGTSEEVITKVLVSHNNEQRQQIRADYETLAGKDLIDELKSELGGNFEEAILGLLLPPIEYDAKMLHDAVKGAGTEEQTLVGVMCTRNNAELTEIKEKYLEKYENELEADLDADCSGNFQRLMHSLVQANRNSSEGVEEEEAVEQAKQLLEAGVNAWGTDELDFNMILCLQSYPQLRCVFEKYRQAREEAKGEAKEIEEDIADEMGSDLGDGYVAIVKLTKDMCGYFAERLHECMACWGTHDAELIRIIISRSERDLKWVKKSYLDKYGKTLEEAVEGECSGDYLQCLRSIIRGNFVEDE